MKHSRVTPLGLFMGLHMTELAERGLKLLQAAGLDREDRVMRAEMCASCACRPGTVPNGCLQTQMDLLKTVVEGIPFLCHAPHDGRFCAGWARARAEVVAHPPSASLVAMVAAYELSPPDQDHTPDTKKGRS